MQIAQDEIAAGKVSYVRSDTPVHEPEVAGVDIPMFAIS
jgi:DNA-directed RNA polymerase subunit omega